MYNCADNQYTSSTGANDEYVLLKKFNWFNSYENSTTHCSRDKSNLLHSFNDKPAFIITSLGREPGKINSLLNVWCHHGLVHRDKGPAVISKYFGSEENYLCYMDEPLIYIDPSKAQVGSSFKSSDQFYLVVKKMNKRVYQCVAGNRKVYASIDPFGSIPDEYLP